MKKIVAALGFWFGLTALAAAQVPNFPQTLPANTVVGRLGTGAGPSQAIPFATLARNLSSTLGICTPAQTLGFVAGDTLANGTANDNAWNSWFGSLAAAGGCIEFGAGKFRFNAAKSAALSGTAGSIASISIIGAGQDLTTFYFPNTAGFTLTGASQRHSFHLRGFSITTGAQGAGAAIATTNSSTFIGTFTAQSDVENVTCRGEDGYAVTAYWSTCHAVTGWTDITWINFKAYGDSTALHGTGVSVVATGASN